MRHRQAEVDVKRISRRGFIKGATVTAIAAGTAVTGHTVLEEKSAETIIHSAPIVSSVPTAIPLSSINTQDPDLITRIATLNADNLRLQSELTAVQQQLLTLQQANSNDTIQTDALTIELDNANQKIGILAGLIGLYEQFDDVGIDDVVDKGLTAVSTTITNLLDDLPSLQEGVQLGQVALDDFEAHLPILQNGRQWLTRHFEQLNGRFSAVETILQETVERIGPLFTMIQDWFATLNKWLPFNIGQRAVQVMEKITDLVLETPNTLAGISTNIAEPLDVLLSETDDQHPIKQTLIQPIREQLIDKTNTAVAKTQQLTITYANELELPAKTAVDRQKIIRQLINDYRQQHTI